MNSVLQSVQQGSFPQPTEINAGVPVPLEAICLKAMAKEPDNHVSMELLPGDIQFINNYHVLHGRTAYEDDRAGGRIRHLKRLWLETRVLSSRPPQFANRSHWEGRRSTSRLRVGSEDS